MLSRVADSLYWMSRYLERAEHTARVMSVHLNLMLEHDPGFEGRRWIRVMACLGNQEPVDGDPFASAASYALKQVVMLIGDARENARQVREEISSEMWEQLNRLFHESKRMVAAEYWNSRPHDLLNTIMQSSHLFQRITDSTMTHGEGWTDRRRRSRGTAAKQAIVIVFPASKDYCSHPFATTPRGARRVTAQRRAATVRRRAAARAHGRGRLHQAAPRLPETAQSQTTALPLLATQFR